VPQRYNVPQQKQKGARMKKIIPLELTHLESLTLRMSTFLKKKQKNLFCKILSVFISLVFLLNVMMPPNSLAQITSPFGLNLPNSGMMVNVSQAFQPAMIKAVNIYPDNPLKFDFIIDRGDTDFNEKDFHLESKELIKYFMAALTVPEKEMWVNLSPYEKNRIIPQYFGRTKMGQDLLAQDYLLKQLSSSLTYPEGDIGKHFWDRVYSKTQEQFGTTEIPMNTFNKIWIVPQQAFVYEHAKGAFVVKSHLKVMLEEDYLALEVNKNSAAHGLGSVTKKDIKVISGVSSEIVREILIPEIEKEVNRGKIFSNLRQVYNSVILASWYKQALKESLLGQLYVDQNKTNGLHSTENDRKQKIYDQYVEAFSKGVYDFIKKDYDPITQEIVPRKYFSGGIAYQKTKKLVAERIYGEDALGSGDDDKALLAEQSQETQAAVHNSAMAVKQADTVTVELAETTDSAMLSKMLQARKQVYENLPKGIDSFLATSDFAHDADTKNSDPKVDVIGFFDLHSYQQSIDGLTAPIEKIINTAKKQNRPVVIVVEENFFPNDLTGTLLSDPDYLTEFRLFSQNKDISGGKFEALFNAQKRHRTDRANQGIIHENSLFDDLPDPQYRIGLQRLISNHQDAPNVSIALEPTSFISWMHSLNVAISQDTATTLLSQGQGSEYLQYINKLPYHIANAYKRRDADMRAALKDEWLKKYGHNAIFTLIRGPDHEPMLKELDSKQFHTMSVLTYQHEAETADPTFLIAQKMMKNSRPLNKEEKKFLQHQEQHDSLFTSLAMDSQYQNLENLLSALQKAKAAYWKKNKTLLRKLQAQLRLKSPGIYRNDAAMGTNPLGSNEIDSMDKTLPNQDGNIAQDNAIASKPKGGIDLNPMINHIKIQRDGNGVALPAFNQPIGNITVDGFEPLIINVAPLQQNNFLLLLGLSNKAGDQPIADKSEKSSNDLDISRKKKQRFKLNRSFS